MSNKFMKGQFFSKSTFCRDKSKQNKRVAFHVLSIVLIK